MSIGIIYDLGYPDNAPGGHVKNMDKCNPGEETYLRCDYENTRFVFREGKFIKLGEDADNRYIFKRANCFELDRCIARQAGSKEYYDGIARRYKNGQKGGM